MSAHHRKLSSRGWARLRAAVFERDDYRCTICRRFGNLECDHIRPLAMGGSHDPSNLRTVCRGCHISLTRSGAVVHRVHGQMEWEEELGV